jgi:hypothetical protein
MKLFQTVSRYLKLFKCLSCIVLKMVKIFFFFLFAEGVMAISADGNFMATFADGNFMFCRLLFHDEMPSSVVT